MSLRDMARRALKNVRRTVTGEIDVQELLNKNQVKMVKTREYEADDHGNKIAWSYRFIFDNQGRKQSFLQAIGAYPKQQWDDFVSWKNDISNLNGEICVEAACLVPPQETGRMRHQFEHFVTRELVLKG
jgi:hypothetical protein